MMTMTEQWQRIESELARLGGLTQMRLRSGASEMSIRSLELHIGQKLPESFRSFLLVHDGQEDGGPGLMNDQLFLSVEQIRREWDVWRSIDEVAMNDDCAEFMRSDPELTIKPLYANRLWIPLTKDWGGNSIGLDFDPDIRGTMGQVIRFGRDEDTKVVLANSFDEFVERLVRSFQAA